MPLAVSFAALTACREKLPEQPKVDVCVVLSSMAANCFPFGYDGDEYKLEPTDLVGGFWISPDHYAEIVLYKKRLEDIVKGRDN
jgi:hypothetical protein